MLFVGLFELLPDSIGELKLPLAAATAVVSFGIMCLVQWEIHGVI
jgi:hypothetical protein